MAIHDSYGWNKNPSTEWNHDFKEMAIQFIDDAPNKGME